MTDKSAVPSSPPREGLSQRLLKHADEIKGWRIDDDQGLACVELTCEAEELLREAALALQEKPMSDSGRLSDFYRNDLARCARDWATTKNWNIPSGLRERLWEMAEALALQWPQEGHWQQIDTAPKDGTRILAASIHRTPKLAQDVVWWREELADWYTNYLQPFHAATHWMPLPDPPSRSGGVPTPGRHERERVGARGQSVTIPPTGSTASTDRR